MLAFSCNELVDTHKYTHGKKNGNAETNICTFTPVFKTVIARSALSRDIDKLMRKKITFLCVWPNVYISRI